MILDTPSSIEILGKRQLGSLCAKIVGVSPLTAWEILKTDPLSILQLVVPDITLIEIENFGDNTCRYGLLFSSSADAVEFKLRYMTDG